MATGLFVAMAHKPKVGGGEEHAHQMVTHLMDMGEHMVVTVPFRRGQEAEDVEFDSACGYPVIRFESRVRSGQWRSIADIRKRMIIVDFVKAMRLVRPDYVVSNIESLIPVISALSATRLARVPHFAFIHHIPPELSRFDKRALWLQARASDLLLCVSGATAADVIRHGGNPSKVHVIPNGIDLTPIHQAGTGDESESSRPTLLTVARLLKRKGIHRVIKAMPKVLSKFPNARYVVVGDGGYRDKLVKMAMESPARDSIEFTGPVSDAEKWKWYRECTLFVMPSTIEGFGIVYLEANAFGKPVIGGNVMGVPEAVADGETGLLVDPLDVDAIANAIIGLLQNPSEARRLGDSGRKRAERDFGWRARAEQFLELVRMTIK